MNMKEGSMETVLKFMGEDHDRLDGLFNEFAKLSKVDTNKALQFFHDFKIGLQRHIVWEEEILFPLFDEKSGMSNFGPTAVMRFEHRQIKQFLEEIHDEAASGNVIKIEELKSGLLGVLGPHNDKEENILYPWIDQSLDDGEKDDVFRRMENLPSEKYNKCCE